MVDQHDATPYPLVPPTPVPMHPTPAPGGAGLPVCIGLHLLLTLALAAVAIKNGMDKLYDIGLWQVTCYCLIMPVVGALIHGGLAVLLIAQRALGRRLSLVLPWCIGAATLVPVMWRSIEYASPLSSWSMQDRILVFVPLPVYFLLNGLIAVMLVRQR